jgi:hypothetical protein
MAPVIPVEVVPIKPGGDNQVIGGGQVRSQ